MNTIKFQYYSDEFPLKEEKNSKKCARATSIFSGYDIWHRPFMVRTKEEFAKWQKEWWQYRSGVSLHYIDRDPAVGLAEKPYECYFHYIIFRDERDELHRAIVFCAECFIMNEEGQTVDSFNA